jgi:hypothetical protein
VRQLPVVHRDHAHGHRETADGEDPGDHGG